MLPAFNSFNYCFLPKQILDDMNTEGYDNDIEAKYLLP